MKGNNKAELEKGLEALRRNYIQIIDYTWDIPRNVGTKVGSTTVRHYKGMQRTRNHNVSHASLVSGEGAPLMPGVRWLIVLGCSQLANGEPYS